MSFFMRDLFKDEKIDEKFLKPKKERPDLLNPTIDYENKIVPRSYIGKIPGTDMWMETWKAHPDLQKEMLEYQSKCFIWCERREQRVGVAICSYAKNKQKEECMGCTIWEKIL